MNHDYYVDCITDGMEKYLHTLALAEHMQYHQGDVEWISPLPGFDGPSLVFKVSLEEDTAIEHIDKLLPDLKSGVLPKIWFIPPSSKPANLTTILASKGFRDLSDPENPEWGMALDLAKIHNLPLSNPRINIHRVTSSSEFALWIDVVNEALHGWPMLDQTYHEFWLSRSELSFYLAYLDGVPIATSAAIQTGNQASIEFVSTLQQYRNQGAASALCLKTLHDLHNKGVHTATLRASHEANALYTKLGFKPYFQTVVMSFEDPGEH
ncbi:GNAT family N-acetyltransferase [Paenibacillus rhizoplanae]|uniref:GNAT family N-acetyltransferase n=1 Tax=Paenibacillus rhizoplanae TaxID=1917181 RepID=A0ABW5FGU6_9BACL